MRAESIARNYAEALFALAEKSGDVDAFTTWIDALSGAILASPKVEAALLSPKVPKAVKTKLLTDAVAGAPGDFIHFLAAVVKRGALTSQPICSTCSSGWPNTSASRHSSNREPPSPMSPLSWWPPMGSGPGAGPGETRVRAG